MIEKHFITSSLEHGLEFVMWAVEEDGFERDPVYKHEFVRRVASRFMVIVVSPSTRVKIKPRHQRHIRQRCPRLNYGINVTACLKKLPSSGGFRRQTQSYQQNHTTPTQEGRHLLERTAFEKDLRMINTKTMIFCLFICCFLYLRLIMSELKWRR